jgi:hypothetical protein
LQILEKELIEKYLSKGEEPSNLDVAVIRKNVHSALNKLRPSARAAIMLEQEKDRNLDAEVTQE